MSEKLERLAFGNFQRLDPEHGDCPDCGKKGIEFKVYRLGDGTIKKYKECPDCSAKCKEEEVAKEKAAQQASIMGARRKRREESGIPQRFMNEDFSTFEKGYQDKAFKLCWDYVENFPVDNKPKGYNSLFLYGGKTEENPKGNGVGKTHLVCAIAHRILDRWQGIRELCPRVIFVSEPDLFTKIQATMNYTPEEKRYRETKEDIYKDMKYCDLLILDDIGKVRSAKPDFTQSTLFTIITDRYNEKLPMIITANFDVDGLEAHLGGASFDRVWEMIGGKYIKMEGRSYRRKIISIPKRMIYGGKSEVS